MATEVVPTYDKVVHIWWAYHWRFFGLGLLMAVVLAIAYTTMDQVLGIKVPDNVTKGITIVIGTVCSQWVFHRLLTRGFGRFRLVLIEK